jgi:tripartite-type tricarboxylate transporter receptor subunit TctC
MTGTRLVHVPYSGGGPAAIGLMGNNVQMVLAGVPSVLGLVRSGQLRPIAVAAERRLPLLPEVPTFIESGLDFRNGPWFGLLAPAKTPEAIIATLHRETVDILREPATRARIIEQGADVVGSTPAEFRAFIKDETARLAAVIRKANIQLD